MSKGLEALNKIKTQSLNVVEIDECLSIIERELKALEIIKKKGVNVALVLICDNAKEYNTHYDIDFDKLTYDDFDLLKEVLEK